MTDAIISVDEVGRRKKLERMPNQVSSFLLMLFDVALETDDIIN